MDKKYKVYLASPWFNEEQSEREQRVKAELRRLGFEVFSPRESNSLSPITDKEIRELVFANNLKHMQDCNIIFAITDGKDMGTIWEAGFVYGMRKEFSIVSHRNIKAVGPQIVYYCETLKEGDSFNLMLAESASAIITEFDDIKNIIEYIVKGSALDVASVE